ncbi:MAG: M20/M25/M40 family metallo-hydrolase [Chitinophagaceae bacterium]|nr:MAG: M20/M25/M40 family metallo-hydrolase [Chitinophagaceae bacterium]
MRPYLLPLLVLLSTTALSQKSKKEDAELAANLRRHVTFLTSDELEGRRTGTEGERLASEYIMLQFGKAGLQQKGADGFIQSFAVADGLKVEGTQLRIDGKELTLNQDYFPLAWSGNAQVQGTHAVALQEQGSPWFRDIKELLEENAQNPHFDLQESLQSMAATMKKRGATALLIYNSSAIDDKLAFEPKDRRPKVEIPVLYLRKSAFDKYFANENASHAITLVTQVTAQSREGHNVIGYIDNGAATTIVVGAHFDHLGRGEDGNSMYRGDSAMIHRGADDNASGTAAMMELARLLKASKFKGNNYLFIAFSGEELGLFGSKYFVEHPTIDLAKVNYMINLDMLGRLNDSTHALTVGGYGTSPNWGQLYGLTGKKALHNGGLTYRFDSSGTGPSDHTSFYRKDIPVLFYFTGLHSDYHKPGDVADKINYDGEVQVVRHILSVIQKTDGAGKLPFSKTREVSMANTRFSVTMGIMPDYTYPGSGLRVDGISPDRPAQKAGIQAGDVITALGPHKVTSVESYMQALSHFKKGESTEVTYQRNGQEGKTTVQF